MKITVTIDTEGRELEIDADEIPGILQEVQDTLQDCFDGADGEDANLTITFDGEVYNG
jgi:hypothetical protein